MSREIVCAIAITISISTLPIVSISAQAPARDQPQPTGTAVIAGRVVDAKSGEPIRKAQLRAVDSTAGSKARIATTDAGGHYELKHLPAGHYRVSATKPAFVPVWYGQAAVLEESTPIEIRDGQTIDRVDVRLSHAGVVAGLVVDEIGEPIARVKVAVVRRQMMSDGRLRWVDVATRSTNDIGAFRVFGIPPGEYYLSATLPRIQAEVERSQPAYLPTYYPGTVDVTGARRLSIAAGQVLSDMNLVLLPAHAVRVTGTAFDSSGQPVRGRVILHNPETMLTSAIASDGAFVLTDVTPAEYVLQAIGQDSLSDERASMALSVGDSDVTDIALVGVTRTRISGRVVVDRAATTSIRPGDLQVNSRSARSDDHSGIRVPVKDDFTFQLLDWPGRALMDASIAAPGWIVKQVRLNGVDVTESGVEIGTSPLAGLDIEVTNVVSDVSGVVKGANGTPTRHAWIIVFSQDQEKWHVADGDAANPNVVAVRSSATHAYRMQALRPGSYYAAAIDAGTVQTGDWNAPEFLDRLREHAVTFEAVPGAHKTLDLTLTTIEP